ncbi:ABC transporter ATP-binding protein [Mycobacterium sp. JS623]|uniref:ABC transporter ATP-binding protein n=1 Tax=Mycobacterium sp. JS623 TaxID=212767 RepID=UPI001E5EAD0F|nr:ABC transporter ATP-binding protein [Mycobacterium sp. JS623]
MAQAAVMAALCAATSILSALVPVIAGLSVLGTVPMGLLAYRYRFRAFVGGTVAGSVIAFVAAGNGGLSTVLSCAYIGGITGVVKRRGRGLTTVLVVSLVAGMLAGVASVATLMVLSRLRELAFASMRANVDGISAVMGHVPGLHGAANWIKRTFETCLHFWPWIVGGATATGVVGTTVVGWWALSRVLRRLGEIPDTHKLDVPSESAPIAPVPVVLREVTFRYPGMDFDAVGPLTERVSPGEHVAVTGANGSGKTTLMLVLAGRDPATGTIERPGAIGLGQFGGTAVILQHPESQVLGSRVADDVVWGLPAGHRTEVGRLLAEVGLEGFADRDTGGLSGGELQRLAVAAALAREPSLLIADEVTSMIDQRGRDDVLSVFSNLAGRRRMALVHITHYNAEAETADRMIALTGREPTHEADMIDTVAPPIANGPIGHTETGPLLEIDGVGHEYGRGTPWAATALRKVDLKIEEGDGVLIHGGNGSGKSTLAWIMAGLTIPTEGACLLDGRPVSNQVGAVAISFQAARLQLMRGRVDHEVASAAGFSPEDADRVTSALAGVGLDPELAQRRVDQLSGGQMRRVVLAGLLSRAPRALVLDEPLAGLDAAGQRSLVQMLHGLRRAGLTVVVISHDFSGLGDLCPRVLHLHAGTVDYATLAGRGNS